MFDSQFDTDGWEMQEETLPSTEELVTITKAEYGRLLDSEHKLECLEQWGVDNWDRWDEAIEQYREEKESNA